MVAAALRQALLIVLGQLGATLVVAGLFALGWGRQSMLAALVGGGIGVVASAYLLMAMVKRRARIDKGPAVGALFLSWLVKTVLTISLLMVALKSKGLPPLPLLAGLFASLVGYWLSLVVTRVNHADRVDGK